MFNKEGKIKLFSNVQSYEKDGIWITVEQGLEQIRIGSVFATQARESGTGEYEWLKMNMLPCVIWNFCGSYAYFDFDLKKYEAEGGLELVHKKVLCVKEKLIDTPYVAAAWESLSAKGLGLLVKHNLSFSTENEWEQFYLSVCEQLLFITGEEPDYKCRNVNRKNVLSSDSNMYVSLDSDTFPESKICLTIPGVHSDNKPEESMAHVATKCTPPFDIKGRFYAQSFIDVHFKQFLDEAIMVDEEKGYAIFPTRMTKIGIYKPTNKIFGEGRKSMLFYSLITRYFLNPSYRRDSLYGWFRSFNNEICDPPLADNVLQGTFDYVIQRINAPDFFIKGNKDCYVHFFSNCTMTLKEKKSIVGKSRIIRSKQAIKMAIQELELKQEPIIKSRVVEISGVKERTVTKYWSEFLPDAMRIKIEEHKHKYYSDFPLPEIPPSWLITQTPILDEDLELTSPEPEFEPEPVYQETQEEFYNGLFVNANGVSLSMENAA